MSGGPARRDELASGLAAVERRIVEACRAAGRPRDAVTLVVVTKFFPVSDLLLLADLGVTDVGESRAQEASAKLAEVPPQVRERLTVHFIGQVQTNKARQVAGLADVVHTADRSRLVSALDRAAQGRVRPLHVLVQANLDEDPALRGERGGAAADEVPALADEVAGSEHLHLCGLMGVAPREGDARSAFARLAELSARVRERHPSAGVLSAGMSGDLEAAVAEGATHLRVGSAILGARPARR